LLTTRPPHRVTVEWFHKLGESARTTTRKQIADSETEWIELRRKSWAALIRLVYEADPLLCPKCRTQMKIVSVIKDGAVIDKILAHLQYNFEPLPLAAIRPPPDAPPQSDSFSTG
jgi:hypothetical protein